jgi:hypothetical protein
MYAHALMAFGGGPGFGLSLAIGGGDGVAWFPLGPREVYVPAYRASPRYVQNVNITDTTVNVTNVTNVYNNVNVRNVTYMHQNNVTAITAVSRDTFVNARQVGVATVRVSAQQLQGPEVQRGVSVSPERKSVIGAGVPATVRPPNGAMSRQVIAKEPPAPPLVSFQRRQQLLAANPGGVPSQQQMEQLRGEQAQQQTNGDRFMPFGRGNQTLRSLETVLPNSRAILHAGNRCNSSRPPEHLLPPRMQLRTRRRNRRNTAGQWIFCSV